MKDKKIKEKNINNKFSISSFIEKYDKLFIIFLIIYVAWIRFFIVYVNIDHIWNFGNIIKMCRGEVIYKDVNIIITPLFFELGKWFLKIFGENFSIYLIYQTIISVFLIIVIYKLLLLLKLKKSSAILFLYLLIYITKSQTIVAIYISLAFIFMLLGVITLIRKENKEIPDKKYILLESIFAVLAFLSYQKMGAVFAITILLSEVIINKKRGLLNTIKIGGLCLVWLLGFLLILVIQNNLKEFLDLAILGIGRFKNNLLYKEELAKIILGIIMSIISLSALIYMKRKKVEKYKDIRIHIILHILCISSIIICYPIVNEFHAEPFYLGLWVFMLYSVKDIISELIDGNIKAIKFITGFSCTIIVLAIVLMSVYTVIENIKKTDKSLTEKIINDTSSYKGIVLEKKDQRRIIELAEYIKKIKEQNKNAKYIVANDYSNAISLYFGESHGYYDMLLRGNLGLNGEEKIINDVENMDDTYFIVAKDLIDEDGDKVNIFQHINEIDEAIKNNYNKIDELNEFEIYYGKKESVVNEN